MDLGANFPAKLEPFLLMSKSAKGAAAAKLVVDATSAPGVFVFAELLDLPNIQELESNPQHASALELLRLFSYRTYQDYAQNKSVYPELNAAQTVKLKYLSIVTLASERRILPYALLQQALHMPTIRELEDLIIDAIYLGILRGKLDQKEQQLEVEYMMGRDLEPGKLESVLAALKDWATTTSSVLSTLDDKLAHLSAQKIKQRESEDAYRASTDAILRDIANKTKSKNSGPAGGSGAKPLTGSMSQQWTLRDDEMDVDAEEGGFAPSTGKGKNKKGPMDFAGKGLRKRNRM